MLMHRIEVDDEIMAFLTSRARPFVDTPNSVLRRELLARNASRPGRPAVLNAETTSVGEFGIPVGLPEAVSQTLEVLSTMRRHGVERRAATRRVAKARGVARETVADKYGRQLGLSTAMFDKLAAEPSLEQLTRRLVARFPNHEAQIRRVVAALPRRDTA